jgi:hypothetical protein
VQGSLYHGFSKPPFDTNEVTTTPELLMVQKALDQISFKENCVNPTCFEHAEPPLYARKKEKGYKL